MYHQDPDFDNRVILLPLYNDATTDAPVEAALRTFKDPLDTATVPALGEVVDACVCMGKTNMLHTKRNDKIRDVTFFIVFTSFVTNVPAAYK